MFKFEGAVTNINRQEARSLVRGLHSNLYETEWRWSPSATAKKKRPEGAHLLRKKQEIGTSLTLASASPHGWRSYCFGFSDVGFSSTLLLAAALGFEAAAAMTAFGCQKSAATVATASGGLLSSGENRNRTDSVCSTDSAFTCRNFL